MLGSTRRLRFFFVFVFFGAEGFSFEWAPRLIFLFWRFLPILALVFGYLFQNGRVSSGCLDRFDDPEILLLRICPMVAFCPESVFCHFFPRFVCVWEGLTWMCFKQGFCQGFCQGFLGFSGVFQV